MAFQGLKTVIGAFRSLRGSGPGVYDLAQQSKMLLEQGDNEAANRILQQALELFPGHSSLEDISHFLGQKRLQESLAQLRRVVEEARKAYVLTARAFADTDNTQKAIEFVTGAFRRFPDCPDLHLILGEIYLRRYLLDKLPEDGRRALESLDHAARLDGSNPLPRKYLAGLYARIGCFARATEYLTSLDVKSSDEEERRYIGELRTYCSNRIGETPQEDVARCFAEVWEHGEFTVDCRDWAAPALATFGRRDLKSLMVPFVLMEVTAKKWVRLPGVAAVVVQNQIRSKTAKADDIDFDPVGLENVVREVTERSQEACHRMGLGHVKRCELTTTLGPLTLHMFADTWAGVLFKKGSSAAQVRTVTQQCLDLIAECIGEPHADHS